MRVALSIAGSDPTGGAGMQADLQVFRALGVHGAGVITALTVQDSAKLHRVLPVFPNVVLEQLRVLLADIAPHAVKIGMLATDDVARQVELGLRDLKTPPPPIVLDPVLAASDGTPLLEPRARSTLEALIGRSTLVTPNLEEARTLTDCDVSTREGCEAAGCTLHVGRLLQTKRAPTCNVQPNKHALQSLRKRTAKRTQTRRKHFAKCRMTT